MYAYKAYNLQSNQTKLKKNHDLDVTLLFLYYYVGKPDKYHRHLIEVHYLQPVWHVVDIIKKGSEPNMEPYGTPHVIDTLFEDAFSILIINFLFERYDVNHLSHQ